MQEKLIQILSRATDWMPADKIADAGKWRSTANVSLALKQMEQSGTVKSRSMLVEGKKKVLWCHADKVFEAPADIPAAEPKPAKAAAPAKPATKIRKAPQSAKKEPQREQPNRDMKNPFSITGLTGYRADGGKVTLFLDRKLSARSVTLPADKLQQLAAMAKG